jgi:hypothetical protein
MLFREIFANENLFLIEKKTVCIKILFQAEYFKVDLQSNQFKPNVALKNSMSQSFTVKSSIKAMNV